MFQMILRWLSQCNQSLNSQSKCSQSKESQESRLVKCNQNINNPLSKKIKRAIKILSLAILTKLTQLSANLRPLNKISTSCQTPNRTIKSHKSPTFKTRNPKKWWALSHKSSKNLKKWSQLKRATRTPSIPPRGRKTCYIMTMTLPCLSIGRMLWGYPMTNFKR